MVLRRQAAPRTKDELIVADARPSWSDKLPGIDWNFSQNIRDNVMEALSGVKGDNSVKIFGPDSRSCEELARKTRTACRMSAASKTSASSTSGANRTWSSASTPKMPALGRAGGRRQQRGRQLRWAAKPSRHDRRRENVRHCDPLADGGGAARSRFSISPSTSATTAWFSLGPGSSRRPGAPGMAAGHGRQLGRIRPIPSATRRACGCATWCASGGRRQRRTRTANSRRPAPS